MAPGTADDDPHGAISTQLASYHLIRKQRYASVHVLPLCWKDDDIGCSAEIDELTLLFRNHFNYNVWPYKIPSQNPQRSLNVHIAEFIRLFGERDNLIIVYYGGHGGPSKTKGSIKSPCVWAAHILNESPSLDWSMIQPSFLNADCDIVFLLDCCYAGQAARAHVSQNVEFFAATDMDNWTPTGAKRWPSFTKVLIAEMKKMLIDDETVTIRGLQRQMVKQEAGLLRQPFYVSLSGDNSTSSIQLVRLEDSTQQVNKHAFPVPAASLYVRLSLFDPLDLGTAASLIQWMTRDSPRSIENIQVADQVLADAKEATQVGISLLSPDVWSGGRLLPHLSTTGQEEALALFRNLRNALSNPSPTQLTEAEAMDVVNNVKQKSLDLITFIEDSMTRLDAVTLRGLTAVDPLQITKVRDRISMRPVLVTDESFEQSIRVDFDDLPKKDQRLRIGRMNGDPALVEYFYYNTVDEKAAVKTSRQVKRISTLHSEPKDEAFRTLQGLGFSHESLCGPRFGFVYQLPKDRVGRCFSPLSELIASIKTVPLEVRARTASVLCNAVLHLHSIGWYHKSINSKNILIFAINTGQVLSTSFQDWDFRNPYIIGFDCSRPSEAETGNTVDFLTANNIYRHPERWGRPTRFNKYHDLYAFGILLLEIGCWKTLPSMDKKGNNFNDIKDPEKLRDFLLTVALSRVAHAAGTKYAEAVRMCLGEKDFSYEDWQSQRTIRQRVLEPLLFYSA